MAMKKLVKLREQAFKATVPCNLLQKRKLEKTWLDKYANVSCSFMRTKNSEKHNLVTY